MLGGEWQMELDECVSTAVVYSIKRSKVIDFCYSFDVFAHNDAEWARPKKLSLLNSSIRSKKISLFARTPTKQKLIDAAKRWEKTKERERYEDREKQTDTKHCRDGGWRACLLVGFSVFLLFLLIVSLSIDWASTLNSTAMRKPLSDFMYCHRRRRLNIQTTIRYTSNFPLFLWTISIPYLCSHSRLYASKWSKIHLFSIRKFGATQKLNKCLANTSVQYWKGECNGWAAMLTD